MTRFSPMKILLVEDSEDDVEIARRALREAGQGHDLHVVHDGEEALEFLFHEGQHAQAPRPDLILLDLNLPRVNGFDVLKRVRASAEHASVPVIILTTSIREEDVARGYRLGANTYIQKPSNLKRAIAALGEYWGVFATLPPVA